MRTTKIIQTTGIILIIVNFLGYLGGASPFVKDPASTELKVGYFIGSNIFLIVGLILLVIAMQRKKKLKRKKDKELVDSLLSDQKEQIGKQP